MREGSSYSVRDYLPLQQGLRPVTLRSLLQASTVRDYLPLQQGLRQYETPMARRRSDVRDYLPLQQGLRLLTVSLMAVSIESQRLSSITTRIKTDFREHLLLDVLSRQRLSSITTRIKTCVLSFLLLFRSLVRDYLPLQQGLRRCRV